MGSKQNLPLASAVSATDWTRGSKTADIVLIEYGDFQCPACAAFYPMMAQLEREFGDDIQVVFRHFPLQQIHANAGIAAQAAEAAGLQGKFWEMHDMLFEHQQEWSNRKDAEDIFMQYAQRIDLDIEGFKRDIDLSSIKKKIEDDYRSGIASGVSGTPTIFLNGNNIRNPRSYNELRDIVRSLFKGEAEQ
ncbi:MAG: hypothetical protein A3C80_02200 [Candidatus Ryanbacteria bacterium RIFCSPHIGHO2_02_FULL_45_43]|uniref:Thioredoxin domain-containing protein n=1 Tax=Candidatus Ryanbacteria bacterium RIFCSPHIGHO2_01_45_13 TaxID=1802112 RepID=A0A1G2FXP1_9BACT|nr:MAG: hypothetical protein A2718_00630 [Candidatus Ryanbacteria bacterium RIFCSPHIGHO2_01_FULL_44_130]OGZ42492.1 MAG: hypothetical protein A2W41_03475 [Candidatus Ryanbacteria bacterium RIFCSPHIGHO2_01_45_13]OGZ48509.1 MAG: hypothetical protein A3C80_02200 [Candidatus Ryanbacteria bacterium RIFCSPHIGHO2_02_FULL_45_43]OGZ50371.1 MAG: hypothetical protein A3E55_00100 [Candidatus Ryanbacteria bacterium RIFCSPHIGHO2_12_FULL_44_20]OGZ51713.1 MAG: hypothetical protein A3A17_02550 [Candidatus Ryanba